MASDSRLRVLCYAITGAVVALLWQAIAIAEPDSVVDVSLDARASLIYHLECVSGGISCSREQTRVLLAEVLGSNEAEKIAKLWSSTIDKYAVQVRLREPPGAEWPDIGPDSSASVDLRRRIREVLFSGGSPERLAEKLGVIMGDTDVRGLVEAKVAAWPRYRAWWSQHEREWAEYAARLETILHVDAAPAIHAAHGMFAHAEDDPLTVHLVPLPSEGPVRRAFQEGSRSFVEFRPDDDPGPRVAVIVHEYCHYLFAASPQELHRGRWEAFASSREPSAASAFAVLNEALASAIGNGLFMKSVLDAAAFDAYLARDESFYADRATDRSAKALLPLVEKHAQSGSALDRDFFSAYFARADAAFAENSADPRIALRVSQVYYTLDPFENLAIDATRRSGSTNVYFNKWNADAVVTTMGSRFATLPVAIVGTESDYLPPLRHLAPNADLPMVGGARAASCKTRRESGGWVFVFVATPDQASFEFPERVPDCWIATLP